MSGDVFTLKYEQEELKSANRGAAGLNYQQLSAEPSVGRANFGQAQIEFGFEVSGSKWWIPGRTYMRTRISYTKANGAPLVVSDDVAPQMGIMGNLFQDIDFELDEKSFGSVNTRVAQVDALKTRQCKSRGWLESVGASTNWWQAFQPTRRAQVSADGTVIREQQISTLEQQTGRVALGFDAAGAANRNIASYQAATGIITFAANGGAALPADVRVVFPAGSYFLYTAGTTVATSRGVLMKVITGTNGAPAGSTTTIVVEPNVAQDEAGNPGAAADFVRVDLIPNGAVDSRRVSYFETIWMPPLPIFSVGHAMPAGKYKFIFKPQNQSVYKKLLVESFAADKTPGVDFDVNIESMHMYIATIDGPRADDLTYLVDLETVRCQSQEILNGGTSLTAYKFSVSPSTYALTAAWQDSRAGQNTLYSPSKFKINGAANDELKVNRFFITYANEKKPQRDADPEFKANYDYTVARYVDSQIYSGGYYDSGGVETIEEFHGRGQYYHFAWPRDGSERSTEAQVECQFSAAANNGRVLLFDHFRQVGRVVVQSGRIVDARLVND